MYRFYSRRTGWPNGIKVKYYYTEIIEDTYNESSFIENKNGKEIYEIISKNSLKNKELNDKLLKMSKVYSNFYYYKNGIEIYGENCFV